MPDSPEDQQAGVPEKRGEAAWKAAKADVAARNEKARKAGRATREAKDQQAAARRRGAEQDERADLRRQFGAR